MSRSEQGEEGSRLFVVCNRLPVATKQKEDGTYDFQQSPGGLASSLAGLDPQTKFIWFGWPGMEIHRNDRDYIRRELERSYSAVPVFISDSLAEKHYNGFSNSFVQQSPAMLYRD
jgi:trehalose 6-phosphate synthase